MELKSVTIQHFRSITSARKISLGRTTVLVGPNNEGKSNILRALVAAMELLAFERRRHYMRNRSTPLPPPKRIYDWETDYPIQRQSKHPDGRSEIILDFKMEVKELAEFRESINSNLSGTLPIKVSIGKSGYDIVVHKKGPGARVLSEKSPQIAAFIAHRIDLQHIPAIRTARQATETVTNMIEQVFFSLEEDPQYQAALKQIADAQRPILESLSKEVKATLSQFLPKVKSVRFEMPIDPRSYAMRRASEIVVDDGTPTYLRHKGDGIQSLVALGLARHVMEQSVTSTRNLVVAVEEPESHLHPDAIHELRAVLSEMSQLHQVVLTTHNPLFVDRVRVKSNILVYDKKARSATSIEEVREILGVRAADNLRAADLVLVVEGEEDRKSLVPLLSHHSKKFKAALSNHTVAIDSLHGCGNLAYKLSLLRESICLYHCVLDNDDAGRVAFEKAKNDGLIGVANANFINCQGKTDSEFEDWIAPELYRDYLKNNFRITIDNPKFRSSKKWSMRLKESFQLQGKPWSDALEAEIKWGVANKVADDPGAAIATSHATAFQSLVNQLEERLDEIQQSRKS